MLTNSNMKAGRFLRHYKAKQKVAAIVAQLDAGRTVYLCAYTRATKLTAKHRNMLKASKAGTFIQRGKAWDCIDGCKIEVHA